jgi:hypothetical protein
VPGGPGRAGRLLLACALALALGAVCAPRADAFHLGGQRWPGRTITYHNLASGYAWPLARAVEAWNASGARVRFVAKPRRKAQVLIRARGRSSFGCSGYATLGFVPRFMGGGRVVIQRGCDRHIAAGILAHELGHVLGLAHEDRRCATMNSILWARCANDPGEGRWRCRLVERDDVRGAVKLYGGSVKSRGPAYCWTYPPPPPPAILELTPNPPSGADALLRWRNTSNAGVDSVLIVRKRGSCPTGEADGDESFTFSASPGSTDSYEDVDGDDTPLEPGDYCYAFWSRDAHNRTAGPATRWMTYEDVFPPPSGAAAQVGPPSGAAVRLTWTAPPNPLAAWVLVQRKEGTCPSSPEDLDAPWVDYVEAGSEVVEDWDQLGGRWCYALWSYSEDGSRHSRLPATTVVDF